MKTIKNITLAIMVVAIAPVFAEKPATPQPELPISHEELGRNLAIAAQGGNTNEVRYWLDRGADANYAGEGCTPLWLVLTHACFHSHLVQMIMLVCAGANANKYLDNYKMPEDMRRTLTVASEERAKNPNNCKQCEQNCANILREFGISARDFEAQSKL